MKKILYTIALFSLIACNTKTPDTVQGYAATPNGLSGLQSAAATSSTSTNVQSNLLLNPAHGEPGHDCSIAVGAPLKKSATAPQQVPVAKDIPQPTEVKTNSSTQKLNPAHGQPGHDCGIAVGAPLNSKATQSTSTAAPKITVQQPAATKVSNNIPVLNEKGQKLNPAHGLPGHKCEVAVGAPLS